MGKCYPFSQKCPLRWKLLVMLTLIVSKCWKVWLLGRLVTYPPLLLLWLSHLSSFMRWAALSPSPDTWSIAPCASACHKYREHLWVHKTVIATVSHRGCASVNHYLSQWYIQLYKCNYICHVCIMNSVLGCVLIIASLISVPQHVPNLVCVCLLKVACVMSLVGCLQDCSNSIKLSSSHSLLTYLVACLSGSLAGFYVTPILRHLNPLYSLFSSHLQCYDLAQVAATRKINTMTSIQIKTFKVSKYGLLRCQFH